MPALKPSWRAVLAIAAVVVATPAIGNSLHLSSSLRLGEAPVNQPHHSSLTIAQLNPRSEIIRFYKELLGRAPEANGLDYHLGRYNQGRSLGLIEQDIRNSPEGRRMALLLSSDAYGGTVRSIYLTELRREPEAAGLAYYVRQL
ncbi:MAG: DUF4214 domain-containing protein, partial [Cyanobacteria bacterium]|nr:DUF4214 domain-containing protein [Cyanobacteriota bacterium]MDW8203272.1 hypothetical protein [Cyanobacteriota bacterium SKYGB_h_bin112]